MINIASAQNPTRTQSYQDFTESPYGGGVGVHAVSEIKTPIWVTGISTYGSATSGNSAFIKNSGAWQAGRITATRYPTRIPGGVAT